MIIRNSRIQNNQDLAKNSSIKLISSSQILNLNEFIATLKYTNNN